jgi:hypothetical protein
MAAVCRMASSSGSRKSCRLARSLQRRPRRPLDKRAAMKRPCRSPARRCRQRRLRDSPRAKRPLPRQGGATHHRRLARCLPVTFRAGPRMRSRAGESGLPPRSESKRRRLENGASSSRLFAARPALLVPGTMLRPARRQESGGLPTHCSSGRFSVGAVPRDGCLVPGVAATGAVCDVLSPVQERSGQAAIGAVVEVDHVIDTLNRVKVHEEPGPGWTALLAPLGIGREPPATSRVADGKVEPIAEPDAESSVRPTVGLILATAGRRLRLGLATSARAFKDPVEPIGVDGRLSGGRMQDRRCPPGPCGRRL